MKVKIVDFEEMFIDEEAVERKVCPNPTTETIKCERVGSATLYNADNLAVLKEMPDNCIDSAVIDGPYGVGYKGKELDNFNPEATRKATRNHQEGVNHNLQTGICPSMHAGQYDKSRAGAIRFQEFSYEWAKEIYRVLKPGAMLVSFCSPRQYHRMACGIEDAGFEVKDQLQWLFGAGLPKSHNIGKSIDKLLGEKREITVPKINSDEHINWSPTPPITEDAQFWEGFGTSLRSLNEPILLARKPLSEKSIARNVLRHGTGGINIDACRIGDDGATKAVKMTNENDEKKAKVVFLDKGRYPTNVIIDEQVAEMLEEKSTYYYCSKITKREKHAGCQCLPKNKNNHPTVKPIALMEYLVKLVTPPNGICLDIFMGSGTTGIACANLGFGFIGIEREPEYFEIAKARIQHWENVKTVA